MNHSRNQPHGFHCDPTNRIMSFSLSSERTFSWIYPKYFSFDVALGYLFASIQNELTERENYGCDDCSSFVFDAPIMFEELENVETLIKDEINAVCNEEE